MKFGQNFSRTSIEWIVNQTVGSEKNKGEMCQEIFLLIDVGACSELEAHTSTLDQAQPCLGFYSLENSQLPSSLESLYSVSCSAEL